MKMQNKWAKNLTNTLKQEKQKQRRKKRVENPQDSKTSLKPTNEPQKT